MDFVGINLVPRASFLTQGDWSAFSNKSFCILKLNKSKQFSYGRK